MGPGSPSRPSLRSHGELLDADTCCWRSHADLGASRGQPWGKPGTWQDQAWGRAAPQRPNSGSLQLLLAARKFTRPPRSTPRVERCWCASHALMGNIFSGLPPTKLLRSFSDSGGPPHMLSPYQIFGNRPAHQAGAPDFQWVRAGQPTSTHTGSAGGQPKVAFSPLSFLEGTQSIQIILL